MERFVKVAIVSLLVWASASIVTADPIPARWKGEPVVFEVPAGTIVSLSSNCLANDPRVFNRIGEPFQFEWNREHDRLTYRLLPSPERVVFDGIAYHNHTHDPVIAYARCSHG